MLYSTVINVYIVNIVINGYSYARNHLYKLQQIPSSLEKTNMVGSASYSKGPSFKGHCKATDMVDPIVQ